MQKQFFDPRNAGKTLLNSIKKQLVFDQFYKEFSSEKDMFWQGNILKIISGTVKLFMLLWRIVHVITLKTMPGHPTFSI